MADFLGALIGGALGMANSAINAGYQSQQAAQDRRENYMYNEMAAGNADKRTRALYNDFYSPGALLQQYKEVGLSPSLMFGGTPGQGGMSGAQGAGTTGLQTHYAPISFMEGVQAANIQAQTEKTKAETKNIEKDTDLKKLQEELQSMTNTNLKTEFELINSTWEDKETGKSTSLFEMANDHYTYESFLEAVRKGAQEGGMDHGLTESENGQQVLRRIYESASRFNRDIMVLSEETVNASFEISIVNALNQKNFAELNAQAAVQELKTSISTNELTESQKEAWNNLLDRLGKKGSTGRDIAIVLGMIANNFAGKVGVNIKTGK